MANKAISELPQAQNVNNQDLFVLEQSGIAKKLTAETFITEQGIIDALAEALDGHGGISSVTLSSVSGRIRTYLITFTDGTSTTFQVLDGTSIDRITKTSTAGLVDTYTVFMSDGTTTFFTVTNGADGNVSEEMLNDALKDKAPAITETTESSAIANFTDGADNMVMHNVIAEINPVQDLTYGDPYPAGYGTNLIDMSTAIMGYYNEAGSFVPNSNGEFYTTQLIPVSASTTYQTNVYDSTGTRVNGLVISEWDSNEAFIQQITASSFTTTANTAYVRVRNFSAQSSLMQDFGTSAKWKMALGTATTTWTPYANICPISGWTRRNVTRAGKNLFDKSAITPNSWIVANTTTIEPTTGFCVTDYIPVSVGQPITCTGKGASRSIYYDKNKNPIEYFYWNIGALNPLYDGYIRTTVSNDYFDTLQIELGSSTTAYEAPQVQTVTVDWTTEAGTVYGGTIDVTTGLLTVTHAIETYSSNSGFAAHTSGRWYYNGLPSGLDTSKGSNAISNQATYRNSNDNYPYFSFGGSGVYINKITADETIEEFGARLTANPFVICYPLATPQTYQLTPQEVKTLLGTNNVWADTGNVSVTYPADTKMFIEKLTMPTEDDLVANQAITSGKFFMVGNNLYIATAAIASGAKIIEGTNATRLSLADALNRL